MGLFKPKLRENITEKKKTAKAFMANRVASGLPVDKNAVFQTYYYDDKIMIDDGVRTFNLSLDKIKDISIKTDVEIQKAIVSNAGGAVAGGMMFGALGALIGGRDKEKTIRNVTIYLIITYDGNQKEEYIAFDVTNDYKRANEFVKLFALTNKKDKGPTIVDL